MSMNFGRVLRLLSLTLARVFAGGCAGGLCPDSGSAGAERPDGAERQQ